MVADMKSKGGVPEHAAGEAIMVAEELPLQQTALVRKGVGTA
jgi:hypothetical protein